MDIKVKAILAILPFGIAAAVASALAVPAYNDYTAKAQQVEDKKHEQEELTTKLANKSKIQKEKKEIEVSIEQLRANVPKKPELEILNLDLERMCNESGLDMVAFKEPDKEQLKNAGLWTEELENPRDAAKNKIKAAARGAAAASTGAGAAAADAAGGTAAAATGGAKPKGKDASGTPDAGLAKAIVQVKAIGDYAGLMSLVKKLETYQRVVNISEVKASVPKRKDEKTTRDGHPELPDDTPPSEQEQQGDWKKMNISFLLTAYYLP